MNAFTRRLALVASATLLIGAPLIAEPVAIYTFQDCPDGAIPDVSGNGNDAQIDGDYKLVNGKFGKALDFDGDTTSIILPDVVMEGDQLTFAAWVNPKTWKDWARVFDFGAGASGDAWLGYSGITKKLRLDWFTKNAAIQIIETKAPALKKWAHVAVTVSDDTVTLYVDGKEVGHSDSLGILPNQIPVNNFYVGRSNWPDPLFRGAMDDIYIDNKALSADEIKALVKATPVPKN